MMRSICFAIMYAAVCCYSQQLFAQNKTVDITVDTRRIFQTMQNFGASDAWACQFVGQWPQAKKDSIADWLFSLDTMKDGSPKGIGLSLWRFNLGAGSSQQGDASGIRDEWRRAESLTGADGKLNPSLQAGQQWFLQAAKKRNVKNFLAFLNSPPVQFTKNQRAYASKAGEDNLDASQFSDAADYIVDAVQLLEKTNGIRFNYISPVNEPQWDWSDGGQEGNPFSNGGMAAFSMQLDAAITRKKLQAKIVLTESGHIKYLLADEDKPGRGDQINQLFKTSAPYYVGGLKNISRVIAAHSYFSTSPFHDAVKSRTKLATAINGLKNFSYWQSEYCILGDNNGEINGSKRDTGILSALYVAKVLYADIAVANATAWQWWLAVSAYDYKDGLVYVEKSKSGGSYTDSKIMWALGNYSRFVRPGMKRVYASSGNDDCLVTAFIDEQRSKVVLVATNASEVTYNVNLATDGIRSFKKKNIYVTSDSKKLHHQRGGNTISLEPRSITTIVLE